MFEPYSGYAPTNLMYYIRKIIKKMKYIYPLLAVLGLFSCIKEIPPNVNIIVRGVVIDTVKNKPLSNTKIIINGCGQTLMAGILCTDLVDSTRTNANGEFELVLKTEGKSIWYEVQAEEYVENVDYSTKVKVKLGEDNNNIIINARELSRVKVELKVKQNPLVSRPDNPLYVASTYTIHYLYHPQIDTILYLKVLSNFKNRLSFSTADVSIGKNRGISDTVWIGLSDTIPYTLIIENTKELPVQ